jgi:hypothetical protein
MLRPHISTSKAVGSVIEIWPADLNLSVTKSKYPKYKINKKAPSWIVKLLLKYKILTPHWDNIETWTFDPYEQKALHEVMYKCMEQDIEHVIEGKAVFIIGGKEFAELTGSPIFRQVMKFTSLDYIRNHPYRGPEIYGFPIHVIPHMTGVALIPTVLIERQKA